MSAAAAVRLPVTAERDELKFRLDPWSAGAMAELPDIDGDNIVDVMVVNNRRGDVSILYGNPDGSFDPEVAVATPIASPYNGLLADFDCDSALDLAVTDTGGDMWILVGDGAGAGREGA